MTTTRITTDLKPSRRRARLIALTASAAAAATVTSLALGFSPPAAEADPGDTFVKIGTSQLLQSEDFSSIQVSLDSARIRLNRNEDFSPCLGEGNRWTDVLARSPRPIMAEWTRRSHPDQGVTEYIAQAKTVNQAKSYARTLIRKELELCREGNTQFDFHYGPVQQSGVGNGTATWALSYTGDDPNPDGGAVVIRKGSNVGVVYVNGAFGDADQTLESVAKEAVSRLVYSS